MKTKYQVPVRIKAGPADGLEEGQFTAYASVFGNKDSYGDVVMPGAFKGTLERWAAKDAVIPLLFGHRMDDPDFNLGHVDAVEDDHGLLVTGTFDMESPKAPSTYRALKGGRLSQMSFAYDVIEGSWVTRDGDEFFELRELELFEVSIVTVGANQETEVLAVKSTVGALVDGVKQGRVLAQKHIDSLRSAQEAIGAVIAAAEAAEDQDEKASGQAGDKDEGGDVKSEVDGVNPSAIDDWQRHIKRGAIGDDGVLIATP
jgi:uncharacterized protein